MPVKWIAIESLADRVYTTKSDVVSSLSVCLCQCVCVCVCVRVGVLVLIPFWGHKSVQNNGDSPVIWGQKGWSPQPIIVGLG